MHLILASGMAKMDDVHMKKKQHGDEENSVSRQRG